MESHFLKIGQKLLKERKLGILNHYFGILARNITVIHSYGFAPAIQIKFKVMLSSESLFGSEIDEMFYFN